MNINTKDCTYIGAFITMECPLRCKYCINEFRTDRQSYPLREWQKWVNALNKIAAREDLPITLQGGEPTYYPEFYELVEGVNKPMDLLTNLQFNIHEFKKRVSPDKFKRNAPYPSIRVSYHPGQMMFSETILKIVDLQDAGYQIGVYLVEHPSIEKEQIIQWREYAENYHVDFRIKQFLGEWKDTLYGTYKYPAGLSRINRNAECTSSELIIAPNGDVKWCHGDLYEGEQDNKGNIFDESFNYEITSHRCNHFGKCSPCDVKLKTNRFQQYGYCATKINMYDATNIEAQRNPRGCKFC